MKVKNDFVTNSSSTSYIVAIPDNFDPEKYFDKFIECTLDATGESLEFINESIDKKTFCNTLINLSLGTNIWQDNFYETFRGFYEFFERLGFVIAEINSGPDDGTITSVSQTKLKEIVNKLEDK